MILATDWVGLSTFVAAVSTAVVAIIVALQQRNTHNEVIGVHREVKTINSLTLAQMAEAQESRRITDIPEAERSITEQHHLTQIPILGMEDPAPPIPELTDTGEDQSPESGTPQL